MYITYIDNTIISYIIISYYIILNIVYKFLLRYLLPDIVVSNNLQANLYKVAYRKQIYYFLKKLKI